MIAVVINAIGGGLIEVLVSPIVQALPGDEKASAMSMLHSFYCWGHVTVVLLSTLYSVSYTHLDVYKRQGCTADFTSDGQEPLNREHILCSW